MSNFYRKSIIEDENYDLIEYSNIFWSTVLSNDFHEVEDMLSEDCRLQDAFENSKKGCNGCKIVLEKLVEIKTKTSKIGLDMRVSYCKLMRNKTQTRLILKPRFAFKTVVVGIALDWECGVIVNIVIMRDTNEEFFMNDNTIEPISIKKNQIDLTNTFPIFSSDLIQLKEDIKNKEISPDAVVESNDKEISPDTSVVESNDKEKWFPGKFIKKVKAKRINKQEENKQEVQEEVMEYSLSHSNEMLSKLLPPFLVPKPPFFNPTIIVTIIGCTNLKSRLNRIVTRPINSYVNVSIGDQNRNTNVVDNNSNPIYVKEKFIFELNPNNEDQYIVFKVKDKHVIIDEDLLAEIKLPIVSLKSRLNTSDEQQQIILPLTLKEKRFGKGFRKSNNLSNDLSTLILIVTKVDIMQWWMLEELRMRDELAEKIRIEEIKKKNDLLIKEKEKSQEIITKDKNIKKRQSIVVSGEINMNWVENNNCNSCNILFSLTNRKHHCRVCGGIFW